jgi:nucleoid DNA-binding protein
MTQAAMQLVIERTLHHVTVVFAGCQTIELCAFGIFQVRVRRP